MQYMILIHSEESTDGPAPGTPEFDTMMAEWMSYNQMLIDGGHYLDGAGLAGSDTATTVKKSAGNGSTVTDGPFAESKEQLGGYYTVEAADLDKAIELALAIPIADATFEVRPVQFRPEPG